MRKSDEERILLQPRGQDAFGGHEQPRVARETAARSGRASRLRGRASSPARRRSACAIARAATRRGCSTITGPSAASAGGTRVVLPAPGAAERTSARRARTRFDDFSDPRVDRQLRAVHNLDYSDAPVRTQNRLEAARRGDDDLYGDVAPRARARRDQPVSGLSRLRLRSGARGRRRPPGMRDGKNQYAPMAGRRALREAIAAKFSDGLRRPVRSGIGDHGHVRRHRSHLRRRRGRRPARRRGVVFEPCYDSYVPAIQISGGVPVFVTLGFPDYSGRLGRRAAGDLAANHGIARPELAAQPVRFACSSPRTCGTSWAWSTAPRLSC